MKGKIVLILIFTAIVCNTFGQNKTYEFTLDECLDYAYKNAIDLQKAKLDMEAAKARIGETRGLGLPQINGQLQFSNNYDIQTQFLPAVFFADDPQNVPSDAPPVPVKFGVEYSATLGASVSQLIFDGSYFVGLKAAKTYKEFAQRNFNVSKIDLTEKVSKAFFGVLVNQERLSLLDQNVVRLDSLLRETKILHENGFAEKIDVDRIQVTYNNIHLERNKLKRGVEISKQLLKFQMGMSITEKLIITQKINDFDYKDVLGDQKVSYQNRAEYQLLETGQELNQLNLKNIQIGYVPKLSAFWNVGYNSGTNNFSDLTKFGENWFNYGMVGAQLEIPIFDGLIRKYKAQQAKIEILKTEKDKKHLENTIDLQYEQARITYLNGLESLELQEKNMNLAKDVYRISKIKYQEGVGSNLEVLNAETAYKEAETNYFAALFDVLIAKIDLDKSLGNLDK